MGRERIEQFIGSTVELKGKLKKIDEDFERETKKSREKIAIRREVIKNIRNLMKKTDDELRIENNRYPIYMDPTYRALSRFQKDCYECGGTHNDFKAMEYGRLIEERKVDEVKWQEIQVYIKERGTVMTRQLTRCPTTHLELLNRAGAF